MVDIRLLNADDVVKYKEELGTFLHMVLSENLEGEFDVDQMSKKYVEDMERFSVDGSAIIMGAFDGDKIVGFHWGYQIVNLGEKRIHSYLNAIYPEYRGQKIGSRFFRKLEEEAIKKGIYTIEAMCTYSNKGAVNYHLNNGFEIERLKVVKRLDKKN